MPVPTGSRSSTDRWSPLLGDDVRVHGKSGLYVVVGRRTLAEVVAALAEPDAAQRVAEIRSVLGHGFASYFEVDIEPVGGGPTETVAGYKLR
jgi:hypothetical protein